MAVDRWGDKFKNVIQNGCWMRIGDGRNTKFWEDTWLGEYCLKDKFSRLFTFSLQHQDFIVNMGVWDGMKWQWDLNWRRLFSNGKINNWKIC